jgi:hypothetical protein
MQAVPFVYKPAVHVSMLYQMMGAEAFPEILITCLMVQDYDIKFSSHDSFSSLINKIKNSLNLLWHK